MMIQADFSKQKEVLKPIHGVNNGPKSEGFLLDSSKWFVEAGIPYSRLHDTEGQYGCGEFVDIPCVFKCFDADPEDPASYNFEMTDHYIKSIRDVGTKVIYRLGVTIENGLYKKYIYPPKDYRQWARICEGIIRHYTEGWANGFTDGVEYFEIWNEPEFTNHMWIGTDEQFYKLFKDTLIYLKKRFPNVKIGGPATGYTRKEFTEGFFKYMATGERAPLDFFSFHMYFGSVESIHSCANITQDWLKQYGYEDLPVIITEWNHITDWGDMAVQYERIKDIRGAAFVGRAMCEMQKAGYTIANYYDAQINSPFNGLFKRGSGKYHHDRGYETETRPSYYSLKSYGELYRLGYEVENQTDEKSVSVLAASNGEEDGLLIARSDVENANALKLALELKNVHGKKIFLSTFAADNETWQTEELEKLPSEIEFSQYSVVLIQMK